MPNEHRADPTSPPHHGQGRGGSKKESSSLRVSPALHPPERPSPRRADVADHSLGRETRERRYIAVNTCHTLLSLTYKYIVSGGSEYKYNRVYFGRIVPNLGCHLALRISQR